MPPRVPSGSPGTCVSCEPGPARNVQPPGRASGRPIAFTATRARRDHVLLDERRRHLQRRRRCCRSPRPRRRPAAPRSASKSTASRSRTAFAYSLRLSRCSTTLSRTCAWPGRAVERRLEPRHQRVGRRGVGLPRVRAAASRARASCARPSRTPRRAGRCSSAVRPSKLTPAVFARSLWQAAQYCLIVASCFSASARGADGAWRTCGACATLAPAVR